MDCNLPGALLMEGTCASHTTLVLVTTVAIESTNVESKVVMGTIQQFSIKRRHVEVVDKLGVSPNLPAMDHTLALRDLPK